MISIITPTYNRAKVISRTLDSIVCQEGDWELIIVDDGSTDNTTDVVVPYTSDPRIQIIDKENSGAADSRNVGVSYARGEYLAFVDSDDIVLPGWFEALNRMVSDGTVDVAFCGLEIFDERVNKVARTALPKRDFSFFSAKVNFLAGAFVIRKSLFTEIGGFNKELPSGHHTDIEMKCLRLNDSRSLKTTYTDEMLVRVFRHDHGKIREQPEKVIRGTLMLLKAHQDMILRDKIRHASYYRVLAREYRKLSQRSNERKALVKASLVNPADIKNYFRILKSYL